MHLRPGLDALERLINSAGVTPLKDIPDFLGTADLYLTADEDEESFIIEGRIVPLELSQRAKKEGILGDAFVLVVRRLGFKGDVRHDPCIPENYEARDCSHIVLWSLENPEGVAEGAFAKLSVLDIESVSEKTIWLSERKDIKPIFYPII